MKTKAAIWLLIAGTFAVLVLTVYRQFSDNAIATTADISKTTSFEKTAIAVFTQNPTLAFSSTPFFAEIIFNDILRNSTLTRQPIFPDPSITFPPSRTHVEIDKFETELALYLTASFTPTSTPKCTLTPTATRVPRCSPVIANWGLSELSDHLVAVLQQAGITASINVLSVGVEGIDSRCEIPFQPVYSQFNIGAQVSSPDELNTLVTGITHVLSEEWDKMQYISHLSTEINMTFYVPDRQFQIHVDHNAMLAAYQNRLKDTQLVEALGGFKEYIIPTTTP